ncbi:MAG: ribosome recycling factor [Clostridiales Family XIII bacterium]|jgi:ribosome recycling factor|nr:ribosome recycling factor [Clostridiales Family XIII bacterium]
MDTQVTDVHARLKEKVDKTLAVLGDNLNTVRAGRANPALLNKVSANYYGTPTPLKNIANISVPDPRSLLITPFDPKSIRDIEKAIMEADIGINPSNDGRSVRLQIPSLTEERRKELTKVVKKLGEDAKVAVRNIRRDAVEALKKQEKNGDITEDDLKNDEKEVQKNTEEAIKKIDDAVEKKDAEIMEV